MIKRHKCRIFALLMLLPSSAAFTAGFLEDDEDIIWKSGLNLYFKYASQDESRYGRNKHPVDLPEKDINLALKSLEVTEKGFLSGEKIRPVFSVSQTNLLSKHLSTGLKTAKPNQDIIFVMEGGRRKLVLLNEKNFVAGRVFYKDDKLNIIIGEFDRARSTEFERQYDPSGRASVPYSFNHGRRAKTSGNFKGSITPVSGVENKKIGKKLRKDWLMIDVGTASKAYIAKLDGRNNPSPQRDSALEMEAAAKLARESRQMRVEMARMRKDMREANVGAASKTLEERIKTLDALRKDELITQEEYDIKRKEILNDI